MIVEYACQRCGAPLPSPFLIDSMDRDLCAACSKPADPSCAYCPLPLTATDAVEVEQAGKPAKAHATCAMRLANALHGQERAAVAFIRRHGPAFTSAKGGRS